MTMVKVVRRRREKVQEQSNFIETESAPRVVSVRAEKGNSGNRESGNRNCSSVEQSLNPESRIPIREYRVTNI
jgi:hypothetical protein